MGSGRSFGYDGFSASDYFNKIKASEDEAKIQQYEIEVNQIIDTALSKFNNRDSDAIAKHIDTIKKALNTEIEGTVSTLFGGSLAKNTHLTGLSDVDTLVILNKSDLANKSPQDVLEYFLIKLRTRFPGVKMEKGDTSVTVSFKDVDVQLVPAIKFSSGLKIPDGQKWSNIIKPTVFARRLTILNSRLNGKLIPAIKVIKGIVSKAPENMRLSGYHIEALALQIFGNKTAGFENGFKNRDLIKKFFMEASSAVRIPIQDITRQSKNVDDYLGTKSSVNRLMVADALERNFRRMEMADSSRLADMWKDIISINA